MIITKAQLITIMPKASKMADVYVPLINKFATEFGVTTKLEMAHLLSTIALESTEMTRTSENLNYSASRLVQVFPKYFDEKTAREYEYCPQKIGNRVYANRMGNGNEVSGDGYRYRGRGMIQLTGKAMYQKYSAYCGVDLIKQPELIEKSFGALRSAFWYFCKYAKLLDEANKDDSKAVRKGVNGGLNGYATYLIYLKRAKKVL